MTVTLVKGNIVGKRIQQARVKAELSQLELAAAMCVDHKIKMERATISHIESGHRSVKDKEMAAFCDILGVSPNWLFGWK